MGFVLFGGIAGNNCVSEQGHDYSVCALESSWGDLEGELQGDDAGSRGTRREAGQWSRTFLLSDLYHSCFSTMPRAHLGE